MIKKRRLLYVSVGMLLSVFLFMTGCASGDGDVDGVSKEGGGPTPSGEKILKVSIPGNADNLDPQFANSAPDLTVSQPIFNSLVRFKPGSTSVDNLEPDLAESWDSNDDATVWTFQLKEGVQWHHDFGEFTAEDVKWTFERVLNPDTGSPYRASVRNIESVNVIDDYEVEFLLNEPDPNFPLRIVMEGDTGAGAIMKKEAIEDADDASINPVGTGPFMLKEYRHNEKVILEKNPDYFRGEPKLDGIEYITMPEQSTVDVAIEKGEIHVGTGVADPLWIEKMENIEGINIFTPDPPLPWLLHLNTTVEPLDDINVRKAIAHAIDMQKYLDEMYGEGTAELASGVIASNMFAHNDLGSYEYDPDLSKKLLEEAGYGDGLKLPENFANTRPVYMNMMLYIQEELRKVGIEVEYNQADIPTYQANIRDNLNNIILYTKSFKPHPTYPINAFYHGDAKVGTETGVTNFSHFDLSNELIDKADAEIDQDKAEEYYMEIQKEIMEEYVVVPLIETKSVLLARDEVDLGLELEGQMIYSVPIIETTDLTN